MENWTLLIAALLVVNLLVILPGLVLFYSYRNTEAIKKRHIFLSSWGMADSIVCINYSLFTVFNEKHSCVLDLYFYYIFVLSSICIAAYRCLLLTCAFKISYLRLAESAKMGLLQSHYKLGPLDLWFLRWMIREERSQRAQLKDIKAKKGNLVTHGTSLNTALVTGDNTSGTTNIPVSSSTVAFSSNLSRKAPSTIVCSTEPNLCENQNFQDTITLSQCTKTKSIARFDNEVTGWASISNINVNKERVTSRFIVFHLLIATIMGVGVQMGTQMNFDCTFGDPLCSELSVWVILYCVVAIWIFLLPFLIYRMRKVDDHYWIRYELILLVIGIFFTYNCYMIMRWRTANAPLIAYRWWMVGAYLVSFFTMCFTPLLHLYYQHRLRSSLLLSNETLNLVLRTPEFLIILKEIATKQMALENVLFYEDYLIALKRLQTFGKPAPSTAKANMKSVSSVKLDSQEQVVTSTSSPNNIKTSVSFQGDLSIPGRIKSVAVISDTNLALFNSAIYIEAKSLYEKYLHPETPYLLNVDSNQLKTIERKLEDGSLTVQDFEGIQHDVYIMIYRNIFPVFLKIYGKNN